MLAGDVNWKMGVLFFSRLGAGCVFEDDYQLDKAAWLWADRQKLVPEALRILLVL